MIKTALPHLGPDPDPEAAVTIAFPLPLAATEDGEATGDGTGLHHHHPAAGPPLAAGPALTLVATDVPPAVAVTVIADMAVDATAAPHLNTIGHALAPIAAHPHQTGTPIINATGPTPGLQAE